MTAYTLNPDQIVGSFIPNVYIDRITLESGGYRQSSFQENPHIDPSQVQKDAGVVEGKKDYGNDNLKATLQITVKDVVYNNASKWFAQGTLEDTSGNAKTIKDYISIVVLQATTQEAVDSLSKKQGQLFPSGYESDKSSSTGTARYKFSLTELEGDPNVLERHYREYDEQGNSVRSLSKTIASDQDGWRSIDPNTRSLPVLGANPQNLAFFVWAEFDMVALANEFSVSVPNQKQDFFPLISAGLVPLVSEKINSDIVFESGKLVKNAYAFFRAQVDPSKLYASYSGASLLSVNQPAVNQLLEGPSTELMGGTAQTVSAIPEALNKGNLIASKDLWFGPVFYTTDLNVGAAGIRQTYEGWVGGTQFINLNDTPLLVRKTIPNTKIQDFRIAKRLDRLNLSLSSLENKVLRLVDNSRRSVVKSSKYSFFTDIHLSRDKENNCRFFFGIDLRKLVREKSVYAQLFSKNSGWLDFALSNVRIMSMRIFRQRIQGSSEVGESPLHFSSGHEFEPVHELKKFNNGLSRNKRKVDLPGANFKYLSYNPADELIIEAVEQEVPNSNPVEYTLESALHSGDGKSRIQQIDNIFSDNLNPGIYFYTGTDTGMPEITDGYYRYRVELEIQDATINFLLQQQSALLQLMANLEDYFQVASQLGINGIREIEGNPHIDIPGENQFGTVTAQEANFDPIANRFTQKFIRDGTAQWNQGNFAANYTNLLQIFIDLYPQDYDDIRDTINLYTKPATGNLQGCLLFLGLLRKLMSVMERAIGVQMLRPKNKNEAVTNATGQTSAVFETNLEKQGAPNLKAYNIEHTFSTYFDGNISRDTGFDFLGTGLGPLTEVPAGMGIRLISSDTFQNTIVSNELNKIFTGPNASLPPTSWGGVAGGTSLQSSDFSYLTPAIVLTPKGIHKIVSVDGEPDILESARDFMNIKAEALQMVTPFNRESTTSLQESIADFLSYNHNLSVVSSQETETPIFGAGEGLSSNNSTGFTEQQYNQASNDQTVPNQRAFPILWDLVSTGLVSQGTRGGVTLPEGTSQKSINFYDPSNQTSGFLQSGITLTAQDITALPNTIKALVAHANQLAGSSGGFNPQTGNTTSFLNPQARTFLGQEPFVTSELRSKARILFETIGQIDVFIGFGNGQYSQKETKEEIMDFIMDPTVPPDARIIEEPSTTLPIWTKLTRNINTQAGGKWMLCRIRRWENPLFKINKEEGSELPIYEEYFLLQSGDAPIPSNIRGANAAFRTAAIGAAEIGRMTSAASAPPAGVQDTEYVPPAFSSTNASQANAATESFAATATESFTSEAEESESMEQQEMSAFMGTGTGNGNGSFGNY